METSFTGYLGPKTNKNTKTITSDSEFPSVTGRQRTCDTIRRPISCLLPNAKASNIETFGHTSHLFFNDEIMDMIVHNTNNKIRETISSLRYNHPAFINSNKNLYVKETDHIEINALFGLMYLRGLLGMNLQRVDYLFADKGHYAFEAIMSKNRFKFLLIHITFDNHIDRENNWPTDGFAAMQPVWELFNSNLIKYAASSEYLAIDETLYPMRHEIAFRQDNPNKPHKYGVLLDLFNNIRFPYTYKALPYEVKPTAGDAPLYVSSTAGYIKNFVIQTKE